MGDAGDIAGCMTVAGDRAGAEVLQAQDRGLVETESAEERPFARGQLQPHELQLCV